MQKKPLVFLGDSLTMRHHWQDFEINNMGIDAETTQGLIHRLHYINPDQVVVLMIGVNDILNGISFETTTQNYQKILDSLSKNKVYILSLLPLIHNSSTVALNINIRHFNRWLAQEVHHRDITFINLYPLFLDENKEGLKDAFTTDGVHLTPQGYRVWEQAIDFLR